MKAALLAALLICGLPAALAIDTAPAFDDPALQARYLALTHQLRCLQCRSETIGDSNANLAVDLRRQVRELIAAGRSDEQIIEYMHDRYGDYVLYKPPMNSRTLLLWAAPILLLAGGGVIAVVVILRKSRLPDTDPADPGLGVS
jgi:cytochrome c-type biogenesis protein CcmH